MQRPEPLLEPSDGPTVVSHSDRYTELLAAGLWSFYQLWIIARTRRRDDLVKLALEVLPSPASEKIARSIRDIVDARALAAIESWLRDKEAMRKLHEVSSMVPDDVTTQELVAPARPEWGPPLPQGPDRESSIADGPLAGLKLAGPEWGPEPIVDQLRAGLDGMARKDGSS